MLLPAKVREPHSPADLTDRIESALATIEQSDDADRFCRAL